MNKLFVICIIIFSLFNIFGYFKDVLKYPFVPDRIIKQLDDFYKEYPNEKILGFYSDEKNSEYYAYMLYRIQNTIMPKFVDNSTNYDLIFCFSENGICQQLVQNGKAELIKMYSDNLILLKKKEDFE